VTVSKLVRGGGKEALVEARARAVGELVEDRVSLAARATVVAAGQRSAETRRTYASVYRMFCSFVGSGAGPEGLTAAALVSYRDELERGGRSPATVAKHLSALRALALEVDAEPAARRVGSARVARGEPRALDAEQFARLLRMPDRRTRQGKRDLALLHLLGTAGLRRAEACALQVEDVDERQRASDGRLRRAIPGSTSWWVTVTYAKRGRRRAIPLERDALEALTAWVKVRPTTAGGELLVSLPRTGAQPGPLSTRDAGRIVARHAAAAGLPEDRRSPHVLRHTFCTNLADNGEPIDVIRELAGHADIRTTTIYAAVNDERLETAIAGSSGRRRGLARLAAG